jgi:hypothetical protein
LARDVERPDGVSICLAPSSSLTSLSTIQPRSARSRAICLGDHRDLQGSPASGDGTPDSLETSPATRRPSCADGKRDWYCVTRTLPPAVLEDAYLANALYTLWVENWGVHGARKLWHAARRAGLDVGRGHVARLMKVAGIHGVVRGRRTTATTMRDRGAPPQPTWGTRLRSFTWATRSASFSHIALVRTPTPGRSSPARPRPLVPTVEACR